MAETVTLEDGGTAEVDENSVVVEGDDGGRRVLLTETDLQFMGNMSETTLVGEGDLSAAATLGSGGIHIRAHRGEEVVFITHEEHEKLLDMVTPDTYEQELEELKERVEMFRNVVRDAEVIRTGNNVGNHNAAVVLNSGHSWNMEGRDLAGLLDRFELTYIRTGDNDTYDYETDEAGLIMYFNLDTEA